MLPRHVLKWFGYVIASITIVSFASCFTVKDYTPAKPFVYKTSITVAGEFTKQVKKDLQEELDQQIDDSLRADVQKKFFFKKKLAKPPRFDSTNVQLTISHIENYLHSIGYYRDSIVYSNVLEIKNDQHRITTHFIVFPGPLFTLDSIAYTLSPTTIVTPSTDSLQNLTRHSLHQSLLKKGDAFSVKAISVELNRLSTLYRENGFLLFNPQLFLVVWDTLGREMLDPSVDPLQQYTLLQKRKKNPTADIEIRLKADPDSAKLVRYHVGSIKIYPDYPDGKPGLKPKQTDEKNGSYRFYTYSNRFAPKKLVPFLYLVPGDLYKESNYLKTLSKLNAISAWKQVALDPLPRKNGDSVDFEIKMTPAKKMNFNAGVDISYQQGSFTSAGENLLGAGTSFTFTNRNLAKGVNESNFTVRYGIEVSPTLDSIQSHQVAASYSINFPRLLLKFLSKNSNDDGRSLLSANFIAEYRINYYSLRTINFFWNSQFGPKNITYSLRIPNIEFNLLKPKEGLQKLIRQNASYKYIFNDGVIISAIGNATVVFDKKKVTSSLKIGVEESGLITGLFHNSFADGKLYRFIKTEVEYIGLRRIRHAAIAWRIFAGAGFGLPFNKKNGTTDSLNLYMPFFRQYYAGGSGSMRGWTVRSLGPGSTIKSFAHDVAPERYGDMRLEMNFEYRFLIAHSSSVSVEGALFTDIGNIWYIRKNNDFVNGEFNFRRLWTDIAIGSGTGLRADLGFIKLRLDYAYKAKNPSPDPTDAASQNKWFPNWNVFAGHLQFGIGYPF